MTAGEWLDSVYWFPVWLTFGGAIAVWVFYRFTRGAVRVLGTTVASVVSVTGTISLTLFVIGALLLPILLGWSLFLTAVVAKVAEDLPRLRFLLGGLVLALPVALLVIAVVGSMSGSEG